MKLLKNFFSFLLYLGFLFLFIITATKISYTQENNEVVYLPFWKFIFSLDGFWKNMNIFNNSILIQDYFSVKINYNSLNIDLHWMSLTGSLFFAVLRFIIVYSLVVFPCFLVIFIIIIILKTRRHKE